jgi:hypothetical protein
VIALRTGDHGAIDADWRIAMYTLQIIAEEGVGQAIREQEAREEAALRNLRRYVH